MAVTVTVERDTPGGFDVYGDPIPSTTVTHTVDGCGVAPRTSSDINDPTRHGVVIGIDVYAPPCADIEFGDRIVIGSADPMPGRWEIEGEIADWQNKFTSIDRGRVISCKRAAG